MSDGVLTEEQVKDIAYKAAVTMYGDIMKEFEFSYIKKTDCFHVMYFKKYGFIKSASCLVKVISDGTVDSCRLSNYYEFSDFDDTLLENVTKDVLVDYVRKQVKSEHPDYQSFKITTFGLYKINGKYYITMITEVSVSEPEPSVVGKEYLYALE